MGIGKKNRLRSKVIAFTLVITNVLGVLGSANINAMNFNGKIPLFFRQKKIRDIKNKFTSEEDEKLIELVNNNDREINWVYIANQMPNRSARQCRERYQNYLSPNIKKGDWTEEEDELLLAKLKELGNKWKMIADILGNRTSQQVKNRYQLLQRRKNRAKNPPQNINQPPRTITINQPSHAVDRPPPAIVIAPEEDFPTNHGSVNNQNKDNNFNPFSNIFDDNFFNFSEFDNFFF